MSTETTTKKRPDLIAYFAPDRDNARWTEIGAAWANKDGEGFSLRLDLMPTGGAGNIVLRKRKEADTGNDGAGA